MGVGHHHDDDGAHDDHPELPRLDGLLGLVELLSPELDGARLGHPRFGNRPLGDQPLPEHGWELVIVLLREDLRLPEHLMLPIASHPRR